MKNIDLHNLTFKKANYIKISNSAEEKILSLLSQKQVKESDVVGILITLNQKGCAGLAYKIEFAKPNINIFNGFEVIQSEAFNLFINPKIALYLIGTEMEYQTSQLESGFSFNNPNSKGSCGCGESFFV